jgi:hypothetical protein
MQVRPFPITQLAMTERPSVFLGSGQTVLVEFQEVVGGRQQPPLGSHG